MFERFTDEARSVVVRAQQEARGMRAEQIEPVHLLLAVSTGNGRGHAVLTEAGIDAASLAAAAFRAGDPLDGDALAAVGVDLDRVRAAAEAAFGPGALDRGRAAAGGHLPFADGSKKALQESLRAALRTGRRRGLRIDDAHVLAGVLTVADPVVARTLPRLGTSADELLGRIAASHAA